MHTNTKITALLALFSLTACGTPVQHMTASGKVEEVFQGTPEQIKGPLVGMMSTNGFNMTKDTPYMLAFDKPSDNLLANVLLGSRYDAIPNARVSFAFAPMGATTRVIADVSIVTNPGSSFERITPANNNESTGKLQDWLDGLAYQTTPSAQKFTASSSPQPMDGPKAALTPNAAMPKAVSYEELMRQK
jgi:hypothetical protein